MSTNRPSVRLRHYLAAGYVLFIVYASLSPFTGWQEQGLSFLDVLQSPLALTYTWFDLVVNLIAYFPLGLLLGLALRARVGAAGGILLSVLGGVLLSAAMEYAQMYLPSRVSANVDLLANAGGSLLGALLAMTIAPSAWFALLMRWRQHLFRSSSGVDFGLALVALWMFAQVNPSLPMLGNVFISQVAQPPFVPVPAEPFSWLESMAVALNLLMLGSLLLTLLHQRRHAVIGLVLMLCGVALTKFIAAALLLKSWALLLWLNGEAMMGISAGLLLLALINRLPQQLLLWCCAGVTLAYLGLVHGLLDSSNPSSAMPLYHWRYGHLLNYNGLSQTVALVFPFLLLAYLWRTREQLPGAV
ncbi:MAG: VanZ family protein [Sideroxydans sp.]|nr:VanZ family protein [Sideroxydans sp.]